LERRSGRALVKAFGDGVSGDGFRVPGEFGREVKVTKANTTLFAGDRDMFVFLQTRRTASKSPIGATASTVRWRVGSLSGTARLQRNVWHRVVSL
jgi:hypothetical protein